MWKDGLLDPNVAMQLLGNGTDLGGISSGSNPKEPMNSPVDDSKPSAVEPVPTKKRPHGDIDEGCTVEEVLDDLKKQKLETRIASLFFGRPIFCCWTNVRTNLHIGQLSMFIP